MYAETPHSPYKTCLEIPLKVDCAEVTIQRNSLKLSLPAAEFGKIYSAICCSISLQRIRLSSQPEVHKPSSLQVSLVVMDRRHMD
ncbi:hypothetical protein Y1Q_0011064 [Alligator mississippiensis]|uniref:Uncharacterized protein n=1 Tax=Alligator mississippiensis TaxID=8496 RepID=A0A151NWS8_ALLMI|nr:hypothetical protein Y1Q_0011064 [Alligator mississippiensis]